ncbi:CsiV family protein [Agarivorans sp. Alg241-V36]|uniref:CsiV family protein n=1 Tax=Agarivorans sp. Alg241-V36 TaxID=2305992 RepID=UPI0013D709D0|nr:CsiV family protein [Agarivorans sp. Alg241-V36]
MRLTLKTALPLCSLAVVSLISLPSFAQEEPRWFDVEVIFFKRNVVESSQEYWPQPQSLNASTSEPLLAPLFGCSEEQEPCIAPRFDKLPVSIDGRGWPISGATKRQMLSKEQLELNEEFAKLTQHAAFTPLLHLGWREIVAPRNRAKHYQVQAGEDFSTRFNQEGRLLGSVSFSNEQYVEESQSFDLAAENISLFDEPATAVGAYDVEPEPEPAIWELEGGIRVYLQHYLYIESELLLKRPVEVELLLNEPEPQLEQPAELPPQQTVIAEETTVEVPDNVAVAEVVVPNEEQQVVVLSADAETVEQGSLISEYQTEEQLHSFKFDQKRRVRSGEIHYFDHPLMGMLIQIRRSPEEETNASIEQADTTSESIQAAEQSSLTEAPELTSEQASTSAMPAS